MVSADKSFLQLDINSNFGYKLIIHIGIYMYVDFKQDKCIV